MDQANRLRELALQVNSEHNESTQQRPRVIAVCSGKGGVGKTNLSIALSLFAAELGRRVILLDGDLGLANVDVVLDLQAKHNLSHVLKGEISALDALTSAPLGLQVLTGAAGVARLADLDSAQHGALLRNLDELEQQTELLLIDTGAGIHRRIVEFCVAAGETIVVTTPEPTSIADAYAMIKVLAQRSPAMKIWLIVNMAHDRAEAERITERIRVLAKRFLGIDVLRAGFVLSDSRVGQAVRQRRPFSLVYPNTHAAICVREIAKVLGLHEKSHASGPGFFQRMTSLFRERITAKSGGGN